MGAAVVVAGPGQRFLFRKVRGQGVRVSLGAESRARDRVMGRPTDVKNVGPPLHDTE